MMFLIYYKVNVDNRCYEDNYEIRGVGVGMTPQQIMERITQCNAALTRGVTSIKTLSINKAKTEREYKIKKRQKILELRLQKQPATLINDLVLGDEEVADLRLKRDIAQSDYFTAIEAMQNLRLELESYRSMLTWNRAELKNS